MLTIAEETYHLFMGQADRLGYIPATGPAVGARLAEDFLNWQDLIAAEAYTINHPKYDRAFLFVPTSRSKRERQHNNQVVKAAVAVVSTVSGELSIKAGTTTRKHVEELRREPSQLVQIATESSQGITFNEVSSPANLESFIDKCLVQSTQKIIEYVNRTFRLKKHRKAIDEVAKLARSTAIDVVRARFDTQIKALKGELDLASLEAAQSDAQGYLAGKGHTVLQLYNFIVQQTGDRERDNRRGAVTVLSPYGQYLMDDGHVWAKVDAGVSVHVALAEKLKIKPSIVREAYRRTNTFKGAAITVGLLLKALDGIDPSHWPANKDDCRYFCLIAQMAEIDQEAFGKTVSDYVADYNKEKRSAKFESWQDYYKQKIAPYREVALHAAAGGRNAVYNHRAIQAARRQVGDTACINAYKSSVKDIKDMKADVGRKITTPAVILKLEQAGYQVLRTDALEPILSEIDSRLWAASPRSEQTAASAYWHSPNVNIARRISSVAYSKGASWVSLSIEPIKAANGSIFHPLNSDAELREEADAMGHCVWSYGYNCLKHGYHIFSTRDQSGKRLSTLSVIDFIKDGQRKIKLAQDRAQSNHTPSKAAQDAAKWLIKVVNEGELMPDWEAVDASKKEFLAKEIDASVGYDFRMDGQRESIFDVLKPCLPRKALRRGGDTPDGLLESLGLQQSVDCFLQRDNLTVLGIRRLPVPARPVSNDSNQLRLEQ